MKHNTVFVIPFILPWDWSADYQRQTCLELSKKHTVIAYMQKDAIFFLKKLFGKRKGYPSYNNIRFYQPTYVFPFRRIAFIEKINERISFVLFQLFYLRLQKYVLWIFDPCFYFMPKISTSSSLYDCVDYVWSKNQNEFEIIKNHENILIQHVSYFFVNSRILHSIHSPVRVPDAILPQGFRLDEFERYKQKKIKAFGLNPVIGFVGAINHRLDFTLIYMLAKNNPQWSFVLWGKIQELDQQDLLFVQSWLLKLTALKNVITGYSKTSADIPNIIEQFDIAMIPYVQNNDSIRFCFPMKLFEYFYTGKPVISIPIIELKRYQSYVQLAGSYKGWLQAINTLLSCSLSSGAKKRQRRLAKANSWENKVHEIIRNILMNP